MQEQTPVAAATSSSPDTSRLRVPPSAPQPINFALLRQVAGGFSVSGPHTNW